MHLKSTHISNHELTADVEEVVDKLISDNSILDDVPWLSILSVSIIIIALYRRYRKGEITWSKFQRMAMAATGMEDY
jgi:hypothetical protein